jgi:hypothetical protein
LASLAKIWTICFKLLRSKLGSKTFSRTTLSRVAFCENEKKHDAFFY